MSKYQTPCRYDFVGSFLRPEEVKKANADYQEGKISEAEKNQIIDKAVIEVVAKQKELGFHVITDGEFRRTYWHLDFMWGFEGVGHEQTGSGVQFDGDILHARRNEAVVDLGRTLAVVAHGIHVAREEQRGHILRIMLRPCGLRHGSQPRKQRVIAVCREDEIALRVVCKPFARRRIARQPGKRALVRIARIQPLKDRL